MSKISSKKWILTVVTVGFVLFIFRNSMFPGPQSSSQSRYIMNLVNSIMALWRIPYAFTEHFIRKTGHFTEYFILGLLLAVTIRAYRCRKRESVFIELFFLLLVPVLDEFIQIYTPERGSSVADVLLDFSGGLAGMFICLYIFFCKAKLKRSAAPPQEGQ